MQNADILHVQSVIIFVVSIVTCLLMNEDFLIASLQLYSGVYVFVIWTFTLNISR